MSSHPQPHDLLVGLLLVQSSIDRRSDALFQPHGFTNAQFNILNLLVQAGGKMDQSGLAESLLVGKSSISIVLNRMVRDGHVTREPHPKDRRQVVLAVTSRGRALWRKISPQYEAAVRKVFGSIPASGRQRLLDDLETIHRAFSTGENASGSIDRWHSYLPARKGNS